MPKRPKGGERKAPVRKPPCDHLHRCSECGGDRRHVPWAHRPRPKAKGVLVECGACKKIYSCNAVPCPDCGDPGGHVEAGFQHCPTCGRGYRCKANHACGDYVRDPALEAAHIAAIAAYKARQRELTEQSTGADE